MHPFVICAKSLQFEFIVLKGYLCVYTYKCVVETKSQNNMLSRSLFMVYHSGSLPTWSGQLMNNNPTIMSMERHNCQCDCECECDPFFVLRLFIASHILCRRSSSVSGRLVDGRRSSDVRSLSSLATRYSLFTIHYSRCTNYPVRQR